MHRTHALERSSSMDSYRFLTGYSLKILGLALMVADHTYQMFSHFGAPPWLHMLSRVCMPIFLFMAAEGFHHTKDRKKYALRLLVAFWLMGIGNAFFSTRFPNENVVLMNNVFGTMLLGVWYMQMLETFKSGAKHKNAGKIAASVAGIAVPLLTSAIILFSINISIPLTRVLMILLPGILTIEGGFSAVLLAVLFYALRKYGRAIQMIPLAALSILSATGGGMQWMMVFAVIPLMLYNGRQGRKSKWFFYIFYPAHIYVLYMLSYLMR